MLFVRRCCFPSPAKCGTIPTITPTIKASETSWHVVTRHLSGLSNYHFETEARNGRQHKTARTRLGHFDHEGKGKPQSCCSKIKRQRANSKRSATSACSINSRPLGRIREHPLERTYRCDGLSGEPKQTYESVESSVLPLQLAAYGLKLDRCSSKARKGRHICAGEQSKTCTRNENTVTEFLMQTWIS